MNDKKNKIKKIEISKIINNKKYKNKIIKIEGWVKTKRKSKIGIIFIEINDGSCLNNIQIIIKKKKIKNYKKKIKKINNGCSIKIKGKLIINKKNLKYEINAIKFKIIGKINNAKKYPISPKYHSLEYLRKILHLRPRTKTFSSISRIRSSLIFYLHKYLQKKNFFLINTPILTSLDTEGHSKMFEIKNKKFFNKKAYLTVSGQLNLESYSCSLSKVYNIGPVFRAENSNTKKHLAEFWMLETEIAFTNLEYIINLSKNLLSYSFKKILKKNYEDILFLNKKPKNIKKKIKHIKNIIKKKYITISYNKIIKILRKEKKFKKNKIKWGINISNKYEKYLTKKYFNKAIIIKNFPKKIKPFYMKTNKDNKTVSCIDIIFPKIGEIIGGSEREYKLNILDKNIKNNKLKKKKYNWYRDIRKFGTIPHSGFGLGIERILMFITNLKNIRDVIAFPKYPNYINF